MQVRDLSSLSENGANGLSATGIAGVAVTGGEVLGTSGVAGVAGTGGEVLGTRSLRPRVKSQSLIEESLSHSTGEAEAALEFLDGITTIVEMQERQGRFGCISHDAEGLGVVCVGCKFGEVKRDVLDPFIDKGFGFLWCRCAKRRGRDWDHNHSHYHICKKS